MLLKKGWEYLLDRMQNNPGILRESPRELEADAAWFAKDQVEIFCLIFLGLSTASDVS